MKTLVSHGFLDIQLNDKLTNICEVLPKVGEIARLGPEQVINKEMWRFLDRSLEHDGQYIGWNIGDLYREGTYGKIYKAYRMVVKRRIDKLFDVIEAPTEVIVKRTSPPAGSTILPVEDITAHTSEALLHVLAWQTMQRTPTPWAIPQPYEVFGDYGPTGWKSMSLCMSYVNGRTLYSYMQKSWQTTTKQENSRQFLEIMAQVAFILHNLQTYLRLNHRDVKVNNIMIRKGRDPIVLELDGLSFASGLELTLIDFGFACVGCPPPKQPMTVFQAGSWFPMGELCCKAGRDLAQLIYCINCYFPIDEYLTLDVAAAVRAWMQIPWTGGIADALFGFTKEGRPRRAGSKGPAEYHTGIYEFLRRPDVDPTACAPQAIFRACHNLNASLL
jgi:serine/threonine protein kinase